MAQGKIVIDTDIATKESEKKLKKLKDDVEKAGGSISESFDIDLSKMENQFKRAKLSLEDISTKVNDTKFMLKELESLDTELLNFEREKQELKEWEEQSRQMYREQKMDYETLQKELNLIADGYDNIETSITRVKDEMKSIGDIGNLTEKLDRQEGQLERAKLSYENLGFSAEKMGLRVEQAFNKAQEIEQAKIKAQQLEDEMGDITNEANKVSDATKKISTPLNNASTSGNELDKSMKNVEKTTKRTAGASVGISKGINGGVKSLMKYALALFSIRSIYQSLRNLSNLWLQSDDQGAKQVRANLDGIKNALANGLAPVITYLSGLVVQLFGYFNAILKTFFGIDLMSKKLTKNTNNTNKGAKKVTKELKKWTGAFDKADIASENISDNMENAGGSGGMDLPEAKIPTPDISGIVKAFDNIKKAFLDIWNSEQFQSIMNSFKTIFGNTFNSLVSISRNVLDNILMIWDLMAPHLQRGFENIANLWTLALSDIANFTDTWLPILTEKFNTLVSNIFDTFAPLYEFMAQLWADVWGIILELWETHGEPLLDKFGLYIQNVLEIWDKLWDLIRTIIDPIIDVLVNVWENSLKDMLKEAADFILVLWGYAMDFYNYFIAPVIKMILEDLQPVFSVVFGFIGGLVEGALNMVFDTIGNGIKNAKRILGGIIDFVKGVFSGDWKKAWQGVKDIFGGIWDGMVEGLKIPINFLIDSINGLLRGINRIKIPSWVPGAGGKGFNIPTIPRLAKGGVLRQETLNIAGEYAGARTNPEIVTPQNILDERLELALSKLGNMGGSETINLIWNNEKVATAQINHNENKGIQMNGGMIYDFI